MHSKRTIDYLTHCANDSIKRAYFKVTGGYVIVMQFLGWVGGNAPPDTLLEMSS